MNRVIHFAVPVLGRVGMQLSRYVKPYLSSPMSYYSVSSPAQMGGSHPADPLQTNRLVRMQYVCAICVLVSSCITPWAQRPKHECPSTQRPYELLCHSINQSGIPELGSPEASDPPTAAETFREGRGLAQRSTTDSIITGC
jgi:hypothetical protein